MRPVASWLALRTPIEVLQHKHSILSIHHSAFSIHHSAFIIQHFSIPEIRALLKFKVLYITGDMFCIGPFTLDHLDATPYSFINISLKTIQQRGESFIIWD
jgi:hypothetical protein